jgi:hypothetical protein
MRRAFRTFIGVDLGGGKGKTTAIARLRIDSPSALYGAANGNGIAENPDVIVEDMGAHGPWYDEQLVEYLLRHADGAVLAIDAPLTLTACVRCTLPSCPSVSRCEVPTVRWFRERSARGATSWDKRKPRYTPYTQRATEVILHEDFGITPRETLGQGMGPLTARMAYLRRALQGVYTLNKNLLEVYPKATLTQLFPDNVLTPGPAAATSGAAAAAAQKLSASGAGGPKTRGGIVYRDGNGQAITLLGAPNQGDPQAPASQVARLYKRSGHAEPTRTRVLSELPGLRFGPGQWREFAVQNDHQFDALICAYTAYLWTRDGWELPDDPHKVFAEDGWIWFPPKSSPPRK